MEGAKANKLAIIDTFIDQVAQRKAWTRCIDKLFARIEELDATGARTLALALAKRADVIPKERGIFSSFMSSASRAAGLIAKLADRIGDKDARLAVVIDAMKASTSLTFAADCLRWTSMDKDGAGTLDENQTKQAGGALARRIADTISANPDYGSYGQQIGTLLWIWKKHGPEGQMAGFLTGRFREHPDEAARFLDAFIGRVFGIESGLLHKHNFDRSEFDSVSRLIDADVVLHALNETFGDVLNGVTFDKCYELKGDQQTACRFAAIHGKVREENAAKSAAGNATDLTPTDDVT